MGRQSDHTTLAECEKMILARYFVVALYFVLIADEW